MKISKSSLDFHLYNMCDSALALLCYSGPRIHIQYAHPLPQQKTIYLFIYIFITLGQDTLASMF